VGFFADYFWFVLKNVVGWVLILLAFALGPMPGPGGIVVFLVGFGMISFPGKRRLIVRVFRGRRFELSGVALHAVVVALAAVLTLAFLEWFVWREHGRWHGAGPRGAGLVMACAGVAVGAWVMLQLLLRVGNWVVRIMPRVRRVVRPWLRHRGIDLLPPRLRRRVHLPDGTFAWSRHEEGEILRTAEGGLAKLRRSGLKDVGVRGL